MFRHDLPSRELHSLATLVRLSLVDLPSANGFDKPFAASKFEKSNIEKLTVDTHSHVQKLTVFFYTHFQQGGHEKRNRTHFNNSEPNRIEQRRSLHRNSTSWSVWRTERSIWRKARDRNAPTAFAIWAARLRALPRRSKISHAPK